MKMTGAQAIIESLKREQVQVVFGYPGGSVLTLYDELYKAKFPHILTGHEQGAVHAADGYARATGKAGVCFATSGPGVCNMVTGIATANMDSIPLVVISGQVATTLIGRDSFQEADISGITTPITKHNYLVKNVKDLPRVLREAFYIATTGRPGPVLVDVAKDVFDAEFDYEYPETVELRGYSGVYTGQAYDIDRTVAALEQAKRPVLLTGGGIILADMAAPLWDVVQRTQVPVITSLMGKGAVPDSYDAHLGMIGMHGSYAANMAVTKCDLLIAVGTRFDDRITGDVENFAPNAQIVHFDIDKVEINKIVHADISVNGDLRWSMPLFDEKVRQSGVDFAAQFADWRKEVLAMNEAHPFATRDLPDAVSPQKLFEAVNRLMDACSKGKGRDQIQETVNFLGDYVMKHFGDEERLQTRSNYPGYTSHKQFHDGYRRQLAEVAQMLVQEGPTGKALGELNRIVAILITHIRTEDKRMAKFVQEHGA